MKFAAGLRSKYAEYVLSRSLKHHHRVVKSCSLKNAKSIGILFNATHSISFEIVKNFVKEISSKDKEIHVLGFVDSKQMIDHYLYRKGFEFFTHNELNWYNKPEGEAITDFIKNKFDILINLNLEDSYPIRYILSSSLAYFKVGRKTDSHDFHDMMIEIEKEKAAMKEIQEELQKDIKQTKSHKASYENIAEQKTVVELQLNFLINQLLHYLSMLK